MTDTARCLMVVEDDSGLQSQLRWSFDDYEVAVAGDRASAIEQLDANHPAVVLQDLGLPPDASGTDEGFATITDILERAPHTKIIVVTGNGDRDNAVKAIGHGAFDFCSKPLDLEVLRLLVDRAFRVHALEAENRQLRDASTPMLEGIIGTSQAMLKAFRMVEKVAPTDATVLLLGETGTGKELFARALHRLSSRHDGPFVALNCAAIPENLLESELFGYEKGAYTGAHKQTKGKIELATGGTLLLDEIGDMPVSLQAKLLRFIEERAVERIGGREPIEVDVRIVSATHQDLRARIVDGAFREDLYYRLGEVSLRLPPLRERAGDVVPLARHFLAQAASRHRRAATLRFNAKALKAIEAHPWHGNVREMENAINGAVIMADGKIIGPDALHLDAMGPEDVLSLRKVRETAETRAIQRALTKAGGNLSRVAELLGISRPTLYDLMEKHGLKKPNEAG